MQIWLRKWHRWCGIIIALFVILQAGSGALLSIGEMDEDDAAPPAIHQEQMQPAKPGEASEHASSPKGEHEHEGAFEELMEGLHHGGAGWADVYRFVLGLGLVFLAVTGGMIFFRVGLRQRK